MNIEILKALLPSAFLSICAGIIIVGALLYLYIYRSSKKTLYLSIALLGIVGFLFIMFEVLTITSGIFANHIIGYRFHIIQATSAVFFLPSLPFFTYCLMEQSEQRKTFLRYLSLLGCIIAIAALIVAVFFPELLLKKKILSEHVNYIWNIGRGVPGTVYKVRDFLIALWSLICAVLLAREAFTVHQSQHLIFTFFGSITAILTGILDMIMAAHERPIGLFTTRIFSYFSVGFTFFIIISMVGVMKYFIEQTRGIEKAMKLSSLGTLAGGIAHDFNNILTTIVGNVSLLEMDMSPESENQKMCKDIENAAYRAKHLTEQLLTFSKGGSPVKELTPIRQLIQETIHFILSGSGITTKFSLPENLWNVNVDPGQISQVIQNIIINAKQALSGNGEIRVKGENIEKFNRPGAIRKSGSFVKISICDDGPGIPKKHLKNIFDPYYSTKDNGNGLGLYICYSIIKNHNGCIDVISEDGQGACFEIYLPASQAIVKTKEINQEPIIKRKINVLVLEDDLEIQKILSKMLLRLGLDPVFTSKGEETLTTFKENMDLEKPFELVMLDLTIKGGMGGADTAKAISRIAPETKLIVCSGYSHDPVMDQYSDYGFSAMVKKPYKMEEVKEAIANILTE